MEVFSKMFCDTCGTVLDALGECVNCGKNQLTIPLETQKQELPDIKSE